MTADATTRDWSLHPAFASLPFVARRADGLWQLPLKVPGAPDAGARASGGAGPAVPVSAAREDGWFVLAGKLPRVDRSATLWEALQLNGQAAGPAKLVLPQGAHDFELRAEVPAEDGVDVRSRLEEACLAMQTLGGDFLAAASGPGATTGRPDGALRSVTGRDRLPAANGAAGDAPDMEPLLAEAGWAHVPRGPRRFAVDLGIPGQFQQAIVEPWPGRDESVHARAAVAVVNGPCAASLAAAALLLLTLSAVVRMVRGGAADLRGDTALFVGAWMGRNPTAAETGHALSALAVACRMATLEAKALMDEGIARAYLSARGWAVI